MNVPDGVWLFVCPLAVAWGLTALLLRLAPRLRLIDYPSERKVHAKPTPRGGGIAIFLAVSLMAALGSRGDIGFLLSALIFFLGLLDDFRPLPWQIRLIVQLGVSLLAVIICLPPASIIVRAAAVLWIALLTNAFNMLDNMDALSGGVAWIAAGFLAAISCCTSSFQLREWGPFLSLMGALAGFLWFNRPPARIFMGDAGSTFLGFTLGVGSLRVASRPDAPRWSWIVPLCILAVPCYDLVSVVLRRLSQGRSPFHADKQHLSHRLVARGLSSRTAVGVIYLLALASGASGLILYAVTTATAAGWVAGQLGVWWIALAIVEFATKEPRHVSQIQNKTGAGGDRAGV